MVKIEDHCVDCGLPCLGNSCPNRNVKVYYCDRCDCEIDVDDVYEVDGYILCVDCLKDEYRKYDV